MQGAKALSSEHNFESREFPMSVQDYALIQKLAYKLSGIKLSDHKKNMIYGRLARRLRKLKLSTFTEYCDVIKDDKSPEITHFVNAITTNLTAFFRESHHFDFLEKYAFPRIARENSTSRRVRLWSAGCSTGEEAYSIAMVVRKFKPFCDWDVKILATDLDSNVVATASEGTYNTDRIEKVPQDYARFLQASKDGERVRIRPEVQSLITFKQLNLLKHWPMKGPFDIIFCRNVVIYFDMVTQKRLFDRYANLLGNERYLFIGHSENLHNVSDRFNSIGRTVYQKQIEVKER